MIKLVWDKSFQKKIRKYVAKHPEMEGKIRDKLKLFAENSFAAELKNHKLSGQLKGLRAIVIDYDCRIFLCRI